MVTLKFHLAEEEFFDFNYYTAWAAPDKKGFRIRYSLRYLLWYAVLAGIYLFAVRDGGYIGFIIFGTLGLVYFLLIPLLVKRSLRQRGRAMLAQPENKHVLEASEVIVMDTGIIDKDVASETKYTWEAIVRKAETPTSYYLYTNSYHAIVIPKRALANAAERQELQRLMNEHLPLSSEFPDR